MSKRFSRLTLACRLYIALVVSAGVLTVAHASYDLLRSHTPWSWTLLALLTLVSGSKTIKLPSLPATITVSETFVITSVLLFGTSAGTITVALDALVISYWRYRRRDATYKIVFNLFALPLTIFVASTLFFALAGVPPLYRLPASAAPIDPRQLILPLLALAVSYFLLNSGVIALAIALERRERPYPIWRQHFLWLSLNYITGASVAVLLVTYTRDLDYSYLALILPIVLLLYLTYSTAMGRVADANLHLEQLNRLYLSTVETLAMAVDAKDQITHGHIRRVQSYAINLAKRIGIKDNNLIQAIEAAALLHDMGKLAVPEYILNKPGPLTTAEFAKMKIHAGVGAEILSAVDFPYPVVPIVRHHHENWDGSGYPSGLAGTDIPIGARVLSVVDCFDALTSDRPYRPRLSVEAALNILIERRGTMYDPLIVDTFVRAHSEIAPEAAAMEEGIAHRETASHSTSGHPAQTHLNSIFSSTEETSTLLDLANSLASPVGLPEAAEILASRLRRLIPFSLFVWFVVDDNSGDLIVAQAHGEASSLVKGMRIQFGQRLSGWVAAHRTTIRNSDPVLDLGEVVNSMATRPRFCLGTPVASDECVYGVLSLYSDATSGFSERHQHVFEIVAEQVCGFSQRMAATDYLGPRRLSNRTTFRA